VANKFIQAIKDLDLDAVKSIIKSEPKWLDWSERDGKNPLHFVCGVPMIEMRPGEKPIKNVKEVSERALKLLKLLLQSGMDINSIHRIPEKHRFFPGTPLWWAYTRGRNEKLYTYLLKQGADPRHCMYAITWYDDTKAANRFKKYGVFSSEREVRAGKSKFVEDINGPTGMDSPLLAAFAWKKWKMAEWLLKNGADPDAADQCGATALFHAARKKYDAAHIKLLLKHGADPDRPTNDGSTPRALAAKYRDKTILELFE
jgi:ankyrin repeat protein